MVLRIFKMIATSGFLTALECSKFVFWGGSAPDPTREAYSASPDPLAGSTGPISQGYGERKEMGKGEGKGRGKEGQTSPFCKFLDPPLITVWDITPGRKSAPRDGIGRNYTFYFFSHSARQTYFLGFCLKLQRAGRCKNAARFGRIAEENAGVINICNAYKNSECVWNFCQRLAGKIVTRIIMVKLYVT